MEKTDGAENTDYEPVKGGLSDAMKRAASQWGIGRYLYKLGTPWVDVEFFGKTAVMRLYEMDCFSKRFTRRTWNSSSMMW